jgi:endonuclease YncB( thermonuclease family)
MNITNCTTKYYYTNQGAVSNIHTTCSNGTIYPTGKKVLYHFPQVTYIKNYDGDTITFYIPDVHPLITEMSTRIRGVDTPERRTKDQCEKDLSDYARNFTRDMLNSNDTISLEKVTGDKYFRFLASVEIGGKSLSEALLKNHLGVRYDGGKKADTDWCEMLSQHENSLEIQGLDTEQKDEL